jgi:Glycosyl transferase family 90
MQQPEQQQPSNASNASNASNEGVVNSRYHYTTKHFTAGDEYQFQFYNQSNDFHSSPAPTTESSSSPSPSPSSSALWHKYKGTPQSMRNTFSHLYGKYKKAIYCQVMDASLSVYLPFSQYNYRNEWSHLLQYDETPLRKSATLVGYKFDPHRVNEPQRWYANNAVFRYEYPPASSKTTYGIGVSDMFRDLCVAYPDVPNVQFFINKRDSPLMRRDECEPFDAIYGPKVPLVSHKYDAYIPVLSMCGNDEFADILIPTWDDWSRVNLPEGMRHGLDLVPWDTRIPTAVFRGSSTGAGVTPATNVRLHLVALSDEQPMIDGEPPLLDAGITKWNCRPRIHKGTLVTFAPRDMTPKVPFMTRQEQMTYKYVVHVEGHVCAFRLPSDLYSGSVVLFVDCQHRLWFTHLLRPYVHYVPVKRDLSDLLTQIEWCRSHDDECRAIVHNAKVFYDTYLTKQSMLSYLYTTLCDIARHMGEYRNAPQVPEHVATQYFKIETPTEILELKTRGLTIIDNAYLYKEDALYAQRECTMGMYVNELRKTYPHQFALTYGSSSPTDVYVEYHSVPTLADFIRSPTFDMTEFIRHVQTVLTALSYAQKKSRFQWNDAYPKRVVLTSNGPMMVNYRYATANATTATAQSSNPSGAMMDCLCLVFSSMYMILKHQRLSKADLGTVFDTVTFLSGRGFRSLADIKLYLFKNNRGLNTYTPVRCVDDFIAHLNAHQNLPLTKGTK